MQKRNIILDTDISNEIDDQFALCYLMKSIEDFNLQAITIAPFSASHYVDTKTIEDGTNISFLAAEKILDLLKKQEYKNKIYKGATVYFKDSKALNDASKKIIEVAKANVHTTIVAIGAITNIALAIYHAPEISKKIDIIWLGGHSPMSLKNDEYNFMQDVEAVKIVFNSKAKVVVIPCKNVASNLSTTIFELEYYLSKCGKIGQYLCEIFEMRKKSFKISEFDSVGRAKVLWDLSAIGFLINPNWFTVKKYFVPEIENLSYKFTQSDSFVDFVIDLDRNKIYQDFFFKMGKKD